MTKQTFIPLIIILLVASFLYADEWPAPIPFSVVSGGHIYIAEIFPASTRYSDGNKPKCFLYRFKSYSLKKPVEVELIWEGNLANKVSPVNAYLTIDGYLITFNEWHKVGFENSVVLYDNRGKLIKSYGLEDLLPEAEIKLVRRSKSSRWWNKNSKYYIDRLHHYLYVSLQDGKLLQINYKTGFTKYGPSESFESIPIGKNNFLSFPITLSYRKIELRYSSITDIEKVHNK